MTDYFVDASALVKRYADEAGSGRIHQITDSPAGNIVLLAEITIAEVAAAFSAKHRAPGGITREERDRALGRFLQDCDEHYLLIPVERTVIDRAVELTQTHRLRGYDAVQLATALVTRDTLRSQDLPAPIFVSSDKDLLSAAGAESLSFENPLDHK